MKLVQNSFYIMFGFTSLTVYNRISFYFIIKINVYRLMV